MKALLAFVATTACLLVSPITAADTLPTNMTEVLPVQAAPSQDKIALLDTLPANKQKIVKEALQAMQDDKQAKLEKVAKIRDELKSIYSAGKFDSMAYLGKVNQLKVLHDQMHANRTRTMVSLATKLNSDERAIVMEMLTPAS